MQWYMISFVLFSVPLLVYRIFLIINFVFKLDAISWCLINLFFYSTVLTLRPGTTLIFQNIPLVLSKNWITAFLSIIVPNSQRKVENGISLQHTPNSTISDIGSCITVWLMSAVNISKETICPIISYTYYTTNIHPSQFISTPNITNDMSTTDPFYF